MMNAREHRSPAEREFGGDPTGQKSKTASQQNTPGPWIQDIKRDQEWWRYVCLARKHQRNNQLAKYEEDFNSGSLDLNSPTLMRAAIALVRIKIGRNMPATPTEAQLDDVDGWIAELVAERRRNVWSEKYSRELELLCRLESVIARHDAEHGGFERRQLNTNNPFYIRVEDGGISNMHIVCLANFFAGNRDKRSFDDSWKIVSEFLAKRKAEAQS